MFSVKMSGKWSFWMTHTHSSFYYVYDDEFNDQFINSLQKIRTFIRNIVASMSSMTYNFHQQITTVRKGYHSVIK